MELQELEPEKRDVDVSGTEPEEPSPGRNRDNKRPSMGRALLLLLAAALCTGVLAAALNWTAVRVAVSPLRALRSGAGRLAALPQPVSVGFLGTVELDGVKPGDADLGRQSLDCSGAMDLQAGEDGMRLFLKDCTLGGEDFSAGFSLYVSPDQAAARAPLLTGGDESWYGVSLEVPLADQAAQAGAGERYSALFDDAQRAEAQDAADSLRASLRAVTELGLDETGREGLTAFLKTSAEETEKTSSGYLLRFTQSDETQTRQLAQALGLSEELLRGPVTLEFTLTGGGVLRGVAADSENLTFTLDLGSDPASDPTPRLEAAWADADGAPRALTLAFTVDAAEAVTAPEYQSVFTLLTATAGDA